MNYKEEIWPGTIGQSRKWHLVRTGTNIPDSFKCQDIDYGITLCNRLAKIDHNFTYHDLHICKHCLGVYDWNEDDIKHLLIIYKLRNKND